MYLVSKTLKFIAERQPLWACPKSQAKAELPGHDVVFLGVP